MPHLVVVHRVLAGERPVRIGLTVSRKVGNAVVRNRVKRHLREGVRRSPVFDALVGVDVVLIARPSAGSAAPHELRAAARTALARLARVRSASAGPAPVE